MIINQKKELNLHNEFYYNTIILKLSPSKYDDLKSLV